MKVINIQAKEHSKSIPNQPFIFSSQVLGFTKRKWAFVFDLNDEDSNFPSFLGKWMCTSQSYKMIFIDQRLNSWI